jgi:glutathione S-transferase
VVREAAGGAQPRRRSGRVEHDVAPGGGCKNDAPPSWARAFTAPPHRAPFRRLPQICPHLPGGKAGLIQSGPYDFPNLPYFDDGDVHLTQSLAIMRHIGRKHGLLGDSDDTADRCNVWLDQARDFREAIAAAAYDSPAALQKLVSETAVTFLTGFERSLGDREWAAGPLTIADFVLAEALAHIRAVYARITGVPDVLAASYPRLAALLSRFEALPRVSALLSSDTTRALPWNGPTAAFR